MSLAEISITGTEINFKCNNGLHAGGKNKFKINSKKTETDCKETGWKFTLKKKFIDQTERVESVIRFNIALICQN